MPGLGGVTSVTRPLPPRDARYRAGGGPAAQRLARGVLEGAQGWAVWSLHHLAYLAQSSPAQCLPGNVRSSPATGRVEGGRAPVPAGVQFERNRVTSPQGTGALPAPHPSPPAVVPDTGHLGPDVPKESVGSREVTAL